MGCFLATHYWPVLAICLSRAPGVIELAGGLPQACGTVLSARRTLRRWMLQARILAACSLSSLLVIWASLAARSPDLLRRVRNRPICHRVNALVVDPHRWHVVPYLMIRSIVSLLLGLFDDVGLRPIHVIFDPLLLWHAPIVFLIRFIALKELADVDAYGVDGVALGHLLGLLSSSVKLLQWSYSVIRFLHLSLFLRLSLFLICIVSLLANLLVLSHFLPRLYILLLLGVCLRWFAILLLLKCWLEHLGLWPFVTFWWSNLFLWLLGVRSPITSCWNDFFPSQGTASIWIVVHV